MSRPYFEQQLDDIKDMVVKMGALVEDIIDMAITSIQQQDVEIAERVLKRDDEIDEMDIRIENECMKLLALQQPIAGDLRMIATALKIITDLERMGDNAVNIAEITLKMKDENYVNPLQDIPRMAHITQEMIDMSLEAFVREDVKLAKRAAEKDEQVDELYEKLAEDVVELITRNKETAFTSMRLMFVGRYIERIADHCTNVCERIIYMITGELREIN